MKYSSVNDQQFMQRALDLARLGLGKVSPNPMVGCVITYENRIVGEGYHQKFGDHHAEVEAINHVKDKSILSRCTAYVTLEPCAHHGKTPPCADLLAAHQLQKVVIATQDSNPLVSGKGILRLAKGGVKTKTGMMEKEAKTINRRFFTAINLHRPYIILKWAQTRDGFIAKENYDSKWISNELSRRMVHKWRAEEDGILVGTNTVLYDNPQLNVRLWSGKDPIRIIIDRNLRLKQELHVFDQKRLTLVYNCMKDEKLNNLVFIKIERKNFLHQLFADLHDRSIQSVIIEGGSTLLNQIIELGLWDEARVFKSERLFHKGIAAPKLQHFDIIDETNLMQDKLALLKNKENQFL